jgi:hypothetical protein
MNKLTQEQINEMREQFAKQAWTDDEKAQANALCDAAERCAAMRKDAEPVAIRFPVTVDSQGVLFGKNYWVSHESITGCVAELIPKRHSQYWEWVLSAKINASALRQEQITECCGITISGEHRYCPKCGWEARINADAQEKKDE